MARPRNIDRNDLLAAAEGVVAKSGATGLSFASVAKAAGVSKGAVQGQFGTREKLIEAMLNRWLAHETERFKAIVGPSPDLRSRILGHLQTMSHEQGFPNQRVATLVAAFVGSDRRLDAADHWYASRIGSFAADTDKERMLRLCFLAAEGLFFVRYIAGLPMEDELYAEIFDDLEPDSKF